MAVRLKRPADGALVRGLVRADFWSSRFVRLSLVPVTILLILAFPLAALAQGETIGGTLAYRAGDERTPVEGVSITVSQDGNEIGTAVSDAEGRWAVPLPGPSTARGALGLRRITYGVTGGPGTGARTGLWVGGSR